MNGIDECHANGKDKKRIEDDKDGIEEGQQVELGKTFEGIWSLYMNFWKIKELINLQNFVPVGAEDKYDTVSLELDNILRIFRNLSRTDYQPQEECCPIVQLTLHDYFSRQKSWTQNFCWLTIMHA